MFRILLEADVKPLGDFPSALTAVEAAYRALGSAIDIQSSPSVMTIPGPRPILGRPELGQYRIKGATVAEYGVAGAFLYTRESPFMYLWDTETDASIGMVACDWLSQYRVAVTVIYAILKLANPDPRHITFFGAGRYSTEACRLIAEQFPHAEVTLIASKLENAVAFAASMPINVIASDDAELAIQKADVVVTMTNAKAPFVKQGWLRPGALLLSMGSAHEVDFPVLQEMDKLFVDDVVYATTQGDLAAWLRSGEISDAALRDAVDANIGEVETGRKDGRTSPNQRILAVLQGLTACDVVVAKVILDHATALGIGQTAVL